MLHRLRADGLARPPRSGHMVQWVRRRFNAEADALASEGMQHRIDQWNQSCALGFQESLKIEPTALLASSDGNFCGELQCGAFGVRIDFRRKGGRERYTLLERSERVDCDDNYVAEAAGLLVAVHEVHQILHSIREAGSGS